MSEIWSSVLKGSFDAGFLIEESSGKILYHNEAAEDLFGHGLEDNGSEARSMIHEFVSFWSFSLGEDDDSVNGNKDQGEAAEDTMTWDQVVKHHQSVVNLPGEEKPVEEWRITGIIASNVNGEASSSQNFPGVLKLVCVPAIGNFSSGNLWLAFIRHADHHDIILNGSVSHTDTKGSARVKRSSRASINGRRSKEARMSIDEDGHILAINDRALDLDTQNEKWKWITTDIIGKHLSATPIAQPHRAKTPPPPQRNMPKMLDMILESGMEPGHSSCPMSGFPLRLDKTNVSAMTTGGAQREENITEAAFEAALDPIFQIDEHGKIQMVNSAAVKTFGWKRSEFLGNNISMICGGGHESKHSAYMARYLATGETRVIGKNRELIAKRKDGSEFPIELGVVEVDTFVGDVRLFCGFVRDLTNIKARERLAQEMVKGALDPVFQINESGTILMVNDAALKAFGYARDEFVGHNVSIICGGSHGSNHDQYIKRYIRTGETRVIGKYRELPARRKDGSEFPIQLAVVEIQTAKNEERLFCGFVHDLSRQKRDQDIMKGTIDTSLDPVLHINDNGIIQMVNNATVKHLGWTREELVGENVSIIVGGGHAANHGNYIQRYLETGEKRAMGKKRKLKARRKDGSEMDIELGLSEIKISGGQERMFCAILRDLSSRQQDA